MDNPGNEIKNAINEYLKQHHLHIKGISAAMEINPLSLFEGVYELIENYDRATENFKALIQWLSYVRDKELFHPNVAIEVKKLRKAANRLKSGALPYSCEKSIQTESLQQVNRGTQCQFKKKVFVDQSTQTHSVIQVNQSTQYEGIKSETNFASCNTQTDVIFKN